MQVAEGKRKRTPVALSLDEQRRVVQCLRAKGFPYSVSTLADTCSTIWPSPAASISSAPPPTSSSRHHANDTSNHHIIKAGASWGPIEEAALETKKNSGKNKKEKNKRKKAGDTKTAGAGGVTRKRASLSSAAGTPNATPKRKRKA
mmetsp:Transcript_1740/g.3289  ORF Transcript_1740/g.3289 Transcript_1740/m.3289 type:complete len:146 (-) Transcript_1740:153-590(-)